MNRREPLRRNGPESSPPRIRTWTEGSKDRGTVTVETPKGRTVPGTVAPMASFRAARVRSGHSRIYTLIYTRGTSARGGRGHA